MHLSSIATPVPAPAPIAVDEGLVAGLRLPKVPGLPGPTTPGTAPKKLLGPPAEGSVASKADMAVVKGAQLLRSADGDAWAVRMSKDGTFKVWVELARRQAAATGKVQGWLDAAIVASTLASNAAVTAVAKHHFGRPRPFQVDPTIKPPIAPPVGSSYPSGHASSAFAAARVIAALEPSLATEAYNLATQVAVSRVYAGVHFPTDVVAGALLGTWVGDAAARIVKRHGLAPDLATELQAAIEAAS